MRAAAVGACVVLALGDAAGAQPGGKPARRWHCDFTSIESDYVRIVGLRSNAPRGDGASIHSNLVGWYAVARRGHAVFEWDVGNWRLLAADSRRPTVDDSPAAACLLAKERVAGLLAAALSPEWRCDFDIPGDDLFYFLTLWGVPPRGTAPVRLGVFAVGRRSDLVVGLEERSKRVVALRAH
jgi:hypothetical protein